MGREIAISVAYLPHDFLQFTREQSAGGYVPFEGGITFEKTYLETRNPSGFEVPSFLTKLQKCKAFALKTTQRTKGRPLARK